MKAAWYERRGPAAQVLSVGEMEAAEPAPGEVRVRLAFSGINPGDTKKRDARPTFPFWPMLFANLTIRLLGSDDFPLEARRQAAEDLTAAAREGTLSIPIADPLPLDRIAEAHDRVDAGSRQRILLAIPS